MLHRTILDPSGHGCQSRFTLTDCAGCAARWRALLWITMLREPAPALADCVQLEMFEGLARLWPSAFPPEEALGLFDALRRTIDWQQESILMFGRRVPVPRLVAWHGDPGTSYTYSGTLHRPLPWNPPLVRIRDRVAELCDARFNAVLLNLYRDGRDGMGWHADDEPELGCDPVIASVSLGATRRFCLRHRKRRNLRLDVPLPHGSLLCMSGPTQHRWVHALPKTRAAVGERINLTFRLIALT
jgi:alkylated DNA repair dioxygenase AlkB